MKISGLPLEERPRERLLRFGKKQLSNGELIAILLQTGYQDKSVLHLSHELLSRLDGGISALRSLAPEELLKIPGIGPSKTCQLLAAIELGERVYAYEGVARDRIASPQAVYQVYGKKIRHMDKEVFHIIMLNTKNEIIGDHLVSMGSLSASIVHPREVFKEAIKKSAASIILMHNHPSGNPSPSPEDISITKRLMSAGEIIGINVLDHVIIGSSNYISLKERNMI